MEEFETYGAADFEMAVSDGREYDRNKSAYDASFKLRSEFSMEVSNLLDKYGCDLMVAPAGTDTLASIGGNPQVSVPLPAYPDGWPITKRPNGLVSNAPGIP